MAKARSPGNSLDTNGRVISSSLWIVGAVLVLGALAAGAGWAGPSVADQVKLDWIVRAVALDWRDFGHERGYERLQYELDRRAVSLHISEEQCALRPLPEGHREVRCDWQAVLPLPFFEPLVFARSARAVVDPDGRLW